MCIFSFVCDLGYVDVYKLSDGSASRKALQALPGFRHVNRHACDEYDINIINVTTEYFNKKNSSQYGRT
jgi:hypothetical protein